MTNHIEGIPDDHFFEAHDAEIDFANETPASYIERMSRQGHYCCLCPKQDPPLPCCNAGHADAVERLRAIERMDRTDG